MLYMQQLLTTPSQTGPILVARRKALKLSQRDVAAKLGISQNRLSELEENPARFTLDRLIALANVLGLELVVRVKGEQVSTSEW